MAPQGDVRTVLPVGPLDLRATLRPLTLTWGRFAEDGWWRPALTPAGPTTLRVHRNADGVHGTAWGPGASWILERLDRIVGLLDDPSMFQPDHRQLAEMHRGQPGRRFGATGLVFDALIYAIVGQKVTGKEAKSGLHGLAARFSDPAPGPRPLLLPPDPRRLAAAPYHELHDLGIEKRRADVLRRVAADAGRIEGLAEESPQVSRTYLERFSGVGVWTSAETIVVSHGDPDAVSVGDFHLKHYVSWHLAGEARGTDERMLELLEPFRPNRARVQRLLEGAGPYPRYGPRQPARDFTDF